MMYLVYEYTTGPEAGTNDHIGPFRTLGAALVHQAKYGPFPAKVVHLKETPSPLMSEAEHIAYMEKRY